MRDIIFYGGTMCSSRMCLLHLIAYLVYIQPASSSSLEKLPSASVAEFQQLKDTLDDNHWWAQVGDNVIHQPHSSSGLSQDVSDYYYAYGSHDALTDELKQKRVAGSGRLHVFHLPDGPTSLLAKVPHVAERRKSVSKLIQLQKAAVLSNSRLFPVYQLQSQNYVSGLDSAGQAFEKKVVNEIQPDKMMAEVQHLTELGDGKYTTRSSSNGAATSKAVDYIKGQYEKMGYQTCLQKAVSDEGGEILNVIAFSPGSKSFAKSGSVILGGHYDSRPYQGAAPGAVDNGSGAAAVLAIARAMASLKAKPKKPVIFVNFGAEERGLWGSKEFAKRLEATDESFAGSSRDSEKKELEQLMSSMCGYDAAKKSESFLQSKTSRRQKQRRASKHMAFVLDEIAWKSPNTDGKSVVNLETFDSSVHVLEALAHSSRDYNRDGLLVTHSGHPFGSDHMSFLERGIESVLSIHGDDEAYPHYHKSSDTIDNVDKELLTKIVRMNAGGVLRMAGISA